MTYEDFQIPAVDRVIACTGKLLVASPTGTGKTKMQVMAHQSRPKGLQLVPTDEIGYGFTKLGYDGWMTYMKCLNRLRDGTLDPSQFEWIQRDEAHHGVDDTNLQIDEFFPHVKANVGWTATLYRGTPNETARLLNYYGFNFFRAITIADAVAHGFMALPVFKIVPLHRDDQIAVSKGEFSISQVNQMVEDKLEDLTNLTASLFEKRRPMMVTLSSLRQMDLLSEALTARGIPNNVINALAGDKQRDAAFRQVIDATHVLIQYKVVGEGVDLPIRIMIDAAPTLSPVMFMQRYGRVTRPLRPGEEPAEIYVTNHNLLRHGYLFEGLLPPAILKDYDKTWPGWKPDSRALSRVIGDIASFGKFKPAKLPLADGTLAFGWVIGDPTGKKHQFAGITFPHNETQYLFRRDFVLDTEGKVLYNRSGKWKRIEKLPDLAGYSSVPASPMTPKQLEWWRNDAPRVGMDGKQEVTNREFQFLPILLNSRTRL